MLFKKEEEVKDLGEVDVSNLEPITEIETEKIDNPDAIKELPEDSKKLFEIILKLKKREELYNKAILVLIGLNLFLTAVVIYLGIVKVT